MTLRKSITLPGLNGSPSLSLMAPDLCPSHQKLVLAIALLNDRLGYPPTYRQVAEFYGCSFGFVKESVPQLVKKGWLVERARANGRRESRSLVLAKPLQWREVA